MCRQAVTEPDEAAAVSASRLRGIESVLIDVAGGGRRVQDRRDGRIGQPALEGRHICRWMVFGTEMGKESTI